MKTHVLLLAKTFPAKHPKAGTPTWFKEKLQNAIHFEHRNRIYVGIQPSTKIHTIRGNYERWKKIIDEVNRGEAVLSIREWIGVPYRSPQVEIARLTKEDGIGLQKLEFEKCRGSYGQPITKAIVRGTLVVNPMLAKNDGLSLEDWYTWFRNYDLSKPLAIIQFTSFRY